MSTIVLPATCDRTTAKSLHPEFCDALGPTPVLVDASKVERIGQAMLQVLLSAARSEGGITLTGVSEPVREAMRLAGLHEAFDEALEAPQ